MKRLLIALVGMYSFLPAQNIQVVYLGIVPGGAPEFEERFDVRLREQISVAGGLELADYEDTEYIKHKTDFITTPHVTRSFIENLLLISHDKAVFAWATVTDFSIRPARVWLVGAEAVGTLTLGLTIYSLAFREYMYLGDVTCEARVAKPPAFFRSVAIVTHITAADRAAIINELEKQAAEKATGIISNVVRSQLMKTGLVPRDEVKEKKVPSVSDLFDIPTIEAPSVDKSDKIEKNAPGTKKP